MYTNKLIKLFFNLKYIQRKKIWDIMLLNGLKIRPNFSIIKDMNIMIKYTSTRSSWSFKNLNYYPPIILTFTWLLEQIKFSSQIRKIITGRKEGIISGFKIKKKNYIHKLDKMFISKPLFKHTSFNLIIDLFVYNNKTNKLRKFENILSRRILYKYMYSLYINYSGKIKETFNRPRFFYINLIEPKTFNYYSNIIKAYENILIITSKSYFLHLCLLVLKWNTVRKNNIQCLKNKYLFFKHKEFKNKHKNIINSENLYKDINNVIIKEKNDMFVNNLNKNINITNKNNKDKIVFKRRIYIKNNNLKNINNYYFLNAKYIGLKNKYLLCGDKYDINKNIFIHEGEEYKKEDNKIKKKGNKEGKSKNYLKYKKYFQELERKSITPIDFNKLTIWSRKGLGKEDIKKEYTKQEKYFRHNKYSLEEFKRKIYYAKGKTKRKVAPKIWKQKLMSFFLFSRAQKKDTNFNKKFFNINNKIINKEFNNSLVKNNIFNMDIIKNKNIHMIDKKYNNYKNTNNLNLQKKTEKVKINSFNVNNKDYIETISDKVSFSLKKENSSHLYFKEFINNKEKKILKGNNSRYDKNLLSGLFNKFFLLNNKNDININLLKDKKSIISKLNRYTNFEKYKFGYIIIEKNNINKKKCNLFKIKDINKDFINSKKLWDNLDYSILHVLSNIYINNDNKKLDTKFFFYKTLFNNIKNVINNNNIWYIHLIKKEFYTVNKDVLLSKAIDIIPYDNNNTLLNNYIYDKNLYDFKTLEYKSGMFTLDINVWLNNFKNKRDNNLINEIGYSAEIFKPYYRYMIPLFIYESYKSFISYLGYKNILINIQRSFFFKFNSVYTNNLTILNFIIVKTLLDLLHYNYRSLLRVKSKYYYLNKLRYYSTRVKRLNFNTWIASVKYIKRLRKTPRQFWLRYHKLASFYYGRIIKNAELDTKRKVLLPFIIYFEDILFNIYGKWVIIRLWPLKRYYLNSFILAERIMLVILTQGSSTNSILEYRQSARNLINIMRWSQIKKAYHYNNDNNSRWPLCLINVMKDNNSSHYLNYNTLEFFNSKLEKSYILSTYPLDKIRLNYYLSSVKFHYVNAFKENFNTIKDWSLKKKLIYKKGKISNVRYVYYWLRPLNSYLMYLKNHLDISGIKFKLTGRPGVIRSNVRSFSKTYFYGNLLGPRHFNSRTLKTTSLTNPILRGTIKSNIDYDYYTSKSNNGSITLKIWMSSLLSNDIHELLLYLLRVKNLYFELVNRYYLVYSKFAKLKNYYLFNRTNKLIWIKKNIKGRKKIKMNINI